ncbi:MAG TPA: hypothetical protein QGF58_19175 [Myxococcota bacterium]|nr:hypothetical protein [Myxococcota bacterium]
MTRREQVSLIALALTLSWFAYPAKQVSAEFSEQRAEALRGTTVEDLVRAVLVAPIGQLPPGPEGHRAGEMLEEAMSLYELQAGWSERALVGLGEDNLAVVAEQRSSAGERSRSHPHTPPEMLRIVELLVQEHGPSAVPVPGLPEESPFPSLPPQELGSGLLALAESGSMSEDEAHGVLSATLAGIGAHERAPVLVEELELLLGDEVVALASSGPRPRDRHELSSMSEAAVQRLKER